MSGARVLAVCGTLLASIAVPAATAQNGDIDVVMEHLGDPVYRVLPPGAIPAIDDPKLVSGAEADAQMAAGEPVLGLVIGETARAYSLWQLDGHEIVNDTIEGTAIAATW